MKDSSKVKDSSKHLQDPPTDTTTGLSLTTASMIDKDTDADDKVNGLSMNEHKKISMNEHEKISMNEHEKISMNEHNTHTPLDGGGTHAEPIFE